jgi:CheY-like chemotaxis protein
METLRALILVVDDDSGTRKALRRALCREGYAVVLASDGVGALDYLGDHPTPSLILLDLMMPGMNGLDFLEELNHRPTLAVVPVIVLSAAGPLLKQCRDQLRVSEFLEKPVDLDLLLETVERVNRPA